MFFYTFSDRSDPSSLQASPGSEHIGHATTADHKVLNEEDESRLQRRYAVVVQDLCS